MTTSTDISSRFWNLPQKSEAGMGKDNLVASARIG